MFLTWRLSVLQVSRLANSVSPPPDMRKQQICTQQSVESWNWTELADFTSSRSWTYQCTPPSRPRTYLCLVIKTKVVQKVNRMSESQKDRQAERQTDFSAQLSKQTLFRMSTGCQNVSQIKGYPKKNLLFENLICDFLVNLWSQGVVLLRTWSTHEYTKS